MFTIKNIYKWMLLCLVILSSIIFVYHNAFLYDKPIAKITDTTIIQSEEIINQYNHQDMQYVQEMTATLQNGDQKGKTIRLTNQYSNSGAYDEAYPIGAEVFVFIDKKQASSTELSGDITGLKRDTYMVIITWIFLLVLFFVGRKQGIYTSVSLALNIILLSYALDVYIHYGLNLIWVAIILTVLFTVSSLLLVNGWNAKSFTAIIATLLGTFLSVGITMFAMWITSERGIFYEEMQFLTRPYKMIFLAGLFIGSLGAVMDVAISMSTSMFELYETNRKISMKALKKSGFNIGKDIMGTMTNILLFAYVSGSIPILIIYLMNHSPLGFALAINLSLELTRALSGGIGIVITIPIGLYVSIFYIKRLGAAK